jgi:hypothetical protein
MTMYLGSENLLLKLWSTTYYCITVDNLLLHYGRLSSIVYDLANLD